MEVSGTLISNILSISSLISFVVPESKFTISNGRRDDPYQGNIKILISYSKSVTPESPLQFR